MSNVLLVEPAYRSKFPPLGLLRVATFHRNRGDSVTFTRGKVPALRSSPWHRVYVSSLFTYELPRTIDTLRYYLPAVLNPAENLIVGGIGATLMPDFIRERVTCRVITGPLDKPNLLERSRTLVSNCIPDYTIIDDPAWAYLPADSYFCRVSTGCIRRCKFCAVPTLEPTFAFSQSVETQVRRVRSRYGERQHLVLLDNNILALKDIYRVLDEICEAGFSPGARRNNRQRTVDFNQGIDARLIDSKMAKHLSRICLDPVRLAFDYDGIEPAYRAAINRMIDAGFQEFTNYVMFNFDDDPCSFYHRLRVNVEISERRGVRITGFPMRFIPINDVNRQYVSPKWHWRYLRGIQCILLATHGIVSPKKEFFQAAFGGSLARFQEIAAMPDRYIIHRQQYAAEAQHWLKLFRRLGAASRQEFLVLLERLHRSKNRQKDLASAGKLRSLLAHYYPAGKTPHG